MNESETTPRMSSELEETIADPALASMPIEKPRGPSEFEKAALDAQGESLASEFWAFLAQNKKWWLAPIVIVMLLLGVLIFLSSTAAAPFIYTLF
jgi:Family of unknown function (DUF5989)